MQTVLLLGAAGLALWYFLSYGKKLLNLEFTPTGLGINLKNLHLFDWFTKDVPFTLTLSIWNPNEVDITMKKIVANIYYKDLPIGTFDVVPSAPVVFLARQSTPIKAGINVPGSKIGGALLSIITAYIRGEKPQIAEKAYIKGKLYTDIITVPINEEVPINVSK